MGKKNSSRLYGVRRSLKDGSNKLISNLNQKKCSISERIISSGTGNYKVKRVVYHEWPGK